jgi:hypothetical protein
MSGYSSVFWLSLCASFTVLGLVLTVLYGRRRSIRAMLHGAAWSLIPIAAYMTGSTLMLWRIGEAIGKFASSFVFDPLRWAGIGVTALIVVLFLAAGGRGRRKGARAARAERRAAREARDQGRVPAGGAAAVTSGTAGTGLAGVAGATGARDAVPQTRKPEARKPEAARRGKAAAADKDSDMADIEEILRKRGI